jgi:cytoskeletal protein CcmA (bactofilin family)
VDGEVEGSIHLDGHNLTIGQNGRVRASLKAKDVVVQGRVDGNVSAGDRLDLRKTAIVMGDLQAKRIAVEDGAFLKGKVETTGEPRPEAKHSSVAVATSAAAASAPAPVSPVPVAESKH